MELVTFNSQLAGNLMLQVANPADPTELLLNSPFNLSITAGMRLLNSWNAAVLFLLTSLCAVLVTQEYVLPLPQATAIYSHACNIA